MSLPSGYRRLEYIQSSGTQYVDTEFKPTGSTKVVCDFQMINQGSSQQGVFGSRPGTSWRFTVFTGYGTADLQVDYNTAQTLASVSSSITGLNVNSRTTLEVSNSLVINGTTVKTVSAASFTSTYNLFLFANNNEGTAQLPGILKLYSCQIYDNGTLVRDFIPCKNTGGAVGLWDDVNSVFYGNAGKGTFTAGPVIAIAAAVSEITKLEYIQSSGTQYINTEIIPTNYVDVEVKFQLTESQPTGGIISAEKTWQTAMYSVDAWACRYNTTYKASAFTKDVDYTVRVVGKYFYINDAIYFTGNDGDFNGGLPLTLFAVNRTDTPNEYSKSKIYYCKIYNKGILVRDYIAAKLPDGTIGMYDKLNSLLYINVGTGMFTAGPSSLNLPVNIGGTWKDANEAFVNIGSTWKTVDSAYVNIGGTWKELS